MSDNTKIVRKRQLDLCVPWEESDERYTELVDTIVEQNTIVKKYENDIALTKSYQKPHKEQLEEAMDELTKGKPQLVDVTEYIIFSQNLVKTQRDDTKEWLSDRAITNDDRDPMAFDVETIEEPYEETAGA